ncbi:MAG TPA: glycosyltransferase family 2 protein [Vicinamibacterales bacterium]
MTDLAIVIVSFNAAVDLAACLASLAAARPSVPHEIIVVDNASSDASVLTARGVPGVQVIPLDTNLGFAAANNVGIRATSGELILLLNSDTIVPPGAIDALVARLRLDPVIAVAGPRLVDGRGQPELSFGRMIGFGVESRRKLLMRRIAAGAGDSLDWLRNETSREHIVDWVSGACLLVRRRDAETVGLLDERFFLYTEDVDFCASIRKLGRKVLFTPVATITHLRGRSRAARPDAAQKAYRRSHVAFYEKHHPIWAPVLKLYLRAKGEL